MSEGDKEVPFRERLGRIREAVHLFISNPGSSIAQKVFKSCFASIVLVSVAFNILLTVPASQLGGSQTSLAQGDMAFYSIFLIESCIRFLVGPSWRSYVGSAMSWADVLGWLPYFISQSVPATTSNFLGFLLSLVPFLRMLKITRVSNDAHLFYIAVRHSARQLLVPLSLLVLSACFFGGTLFFIENALQTQYSGSVTYVSMLDSIYYCIATLTTVGFGGQAPQTGLGRLFSSVMMVSSIIFVAIASVILGVNFDEVYKHRYRYLTIEKMKQRMDYANLTIPAIRELFNFVDLDGSGKIDIKEFETLLNDEFRLGLPQYDIVIMFMKISGDDHLCEFREFCEFFFPDKTFHMRFKDFDVPAKDKRPDNSSNGMTPLQDPNRPGSALSVTRPRSAEKGLSFQSSADCVNFLVDQLDKINSQMKVMRPAIKALAAEYEEPN